MNRKPINIIAHDEYYEALKANQNKYLKDNDTGKDSLSFLWGLSSCAVQRQWSMNAWCNWRGKQYWSQWVVLHHESDKNKQVDNV